MSKQPTQFEIDHPDCTIRWRDVPTQGFFHISLYKNGKRITYFNWWKFALNDHIDLNSVYHQMFKYYVSPD